MPQPKRHCVRWGPRCPSPIFGPCILWPNGWMDQDATWHGGRSGPKPCCARWGPSSPPQKEHSSPPLFGPCRLWPRSPISATAELLLNFGKSWQQFLHFGTVHHYAKSHRVCGKITFFKIQDTGCLQCWTLWEVVFSNSPAAFFQNDILHESAKFGANILNSHSLGRPIEFYSFSKWQPNIGLIAFYMNSKCHSADGIQRDLFVFLPNLLEIAIQSLRRNCNFQIFKTTSNHHHAFKKQSFQVPVRLRVGLCVILPNFSNFLINFF